MQLRFTNFVVLHCSALTITSEQFGGTCPKKTALVGKRINPSFKTLKKAWYNHNILSYNGTVISLRLSTFQQCITMRTEMSILT